MTYTMDDLPRTLREGSSAWELMALLLDRGSSVTQHHQDPRSFPSTSEQVRQALLLWRGVPDSEDLQSGTAKARSLLASKLC